jgi:hypothetical protein
VAADLQAYKPTELGRFPSLAYAGCVCSLVVMLVHCCASMCCVTERCGAQGRYCAGGGGSCTGEG